MVRDALTIRPPEFGRIHGIIARVACKGCGGTGLWELDPLAAICPFCSGKGYEDRMIPVTITKAGTIRVVR